ncbi:hypothetical protein [Actinomyces naeslundii]|uniref:hypothetical protein n=1 Tax=Actinomyces naeslundii TaxID=1655 RepID=UPI00096D8549|nr:hypothetical protein [Actinomyces naeslundii]OMG30713.1 hypothetical protein BKH34_09350 [Actinomyces naeslundii]OMG34879.1 hypothetical protein BKH25_06405 [Actinomyces naeslundii]
MKFRKIASLGGAAALAVAGIIGASPSASASGEWPVDIDEACRLQGHTGAYNFVDEPYNWTCYDMSYTFPFSVTFGSAGSVDIQGYCNRLHPGSRAEVTNAALAEGWSCLKLD